MSDINKAEYRPINAGKNLICEGTGPLGCQAVTVAHSGAPALPQSNQNEVTLFGLVAPR